MSVPKSAEELGVMLPGESRGGFIPLYLPVRKACLENKLEEAGFVPSASYVNPNVGTAYVLT